MTLEFVYAKAASALQFAYIVVSLVALFVGLVGCAPSTHSIESATSVMNSTSVAVTTAESTTSTTQPPFESNFDFHIDPIAVGFPQVLFIRSTIESVEQRFSVEPGTAVILYSSSQSSIDWVRKTARSLNCFSDHDSTYFRGAGGQGRSCGLLMRFDGMNSSCADKQTCKDIRSIAAHEVFHVITYQKLGGLSRKVPFWLAEGTADFVGYAMTRASQKGTLSPQEIEAFRTKHKGLALDPSLTLSLRKMDQVWSQAPNVPTPSYFYDLAFLAVTLLAERSGEQEVLVDYFDRLLETQSHSSAFETTFGLTEDEFDAQFQTWIKSL